MKPRLYNISFADCEVVSSRIINAPAALLYRAWTDPNHLQNWWGPAGFTNTFNEFDLRPGGKWSFVMHGADKGNYQNECVFLEIDKPRLISSDRLSKPIFQVVVTFEELPGGKTKMLFRIFSIPLRNVTRRNHSHLKKMRRTSTSSKLN
jgi:uncharacterized protein YndB with AHSA1/START domain